MFCCARIIPGLFLVERNLQMFMSSVLQRYRSDFFLMRKLSKRYMVCYRIGAACDLHMWSQNVLRNFIVWLNQTIFKFSGYILMKLKSKICEVQKLTEVNKYPNYCVWTFLRLFQMMQKKNFIYFSFCFFCLKVWPEVTDPEKFVYEDVAIATYLLVGNCFT